MYKKSLNGYLYIAGVFCICFLFFNTKSIAAKREGVYILPDTSNICDTINLYHLLGDTCNVTIHKRLIKNTTIQAISLPFDLSKSALADKSNPFYGATIQKYIATRQLRHYGQDSVVFALETVDSIKAGFPYFIHWKNGDGTEMQTMTFKDVVILKDKSDLTDIFSSNKAIVYSSLSQTNKKKFSTGVGRYLGVRENGTLSFFDDDVNKKDSTLRGFVSYLYLSDKVLNNLSENATFHFGNIEDYYLCFTLEDNGLAAVQLLKEGNANTLSLQYKISGDSAWSSFNYESTLHLRSKGQKIFFRTVEYNKATSSDNGAYNHFAFSKRVSSSGSVMSLLDPTAEETSTMYLGAFANLFESCSTLISAPELPAISITANCYTSMFSGCSSLKQPPELPAEEVAPYCYSKMFNGCASLEKSPALPAKNLKMACYSSMFAGCSSLQIPPTLSSINLYHSCYANMFENCTKLKEAPVLPATELSQNCYYKMFSGCVSLPYPPKLPATSLSQLCYAYMFEKCSSLRYAPELPAKSLKENCYYYMFSGCTSLQDAPSLPAKQMVRQCYAFMFNNCTSLMNPPNLNSVSLYELCYMGMFKGCASLITPPFVLPATKLKTGCYNMMFSDCKSLSRSPIISATSPVSNSFDAMFENCLSLDTIIVSFTQWGNNGTSMWVNNVAQKGVFIAPCVLPQRFGTSFIPKNWNFLCQINLYDMVNPIDTLNEMKNVVLQANIHTKIVKNNNIRPLTLPFDVSAEYLRSEKNPLYGAKIQKYFTTYIQKTNAKTDSVLFILENADSIIAGLPYFISWNDNSFYDSSDVLTFKDVFIPNNYNRIEGFSNSTGANYPNLSPIRVDSFLDIKSFQRIYPKDNGIPISFSALDPHDSLYGFRSYLTISDSLYTTLKNIQPACRFGQITDYALCFTAMQNNSIVQLDSICTGYIGPAPPKIELQFSIDNGNTWIDYSWQPTDGKGKTIILQNTGDKVFFVAKEKNTKLYHTSHYNNTRFCTYYQFIMNGQIAASGNIMSLLDRTANQSHVPDSAFYKLFYNCNALISPPDFPALSLSSYCYAHTFEGCGSLVSFPLLPSTSLAPGCYKCMFEGCFSLTIDTTITLPSINLPPSCYEAMFKDCYNLSHAPVLLATSAHAKSCKSMFENCSSLKMLQDSLFFLVLEDSFACCRMFANCTSLTIPPVLPTCNPTPWCYKEMFAGCRSLLHAPNLLSTQLSRGCYAAMFENCIHLQNTPPLPAKKMEEYCYYQLFSGCPEIDSIEVNFSEWHPANATQGWTKDVKEMGTFIAPCGLPDIRGVDNVPERWHFSCKLDLYDSINPHPTILPYLDSSVIAVIHTSVSKDGRYRSFSLPFNVSRDDLANPNNPLFDASILTYAETKVLRTNDGHDSVVFTLEYVDSIIAGKPYFLRWLNGSNEHVNVLQFNDVKMLKASFNEQDKSDFDILFILSNLAPITFDDGSDNIENHHIYLYDDDILYPQSTFIAKTDRLLGFRNHIVLSASLYDQIKDNHPKFYFDEVELPFVCFEAAEDSDKIQISAFGDIQPINLQFSTNGSIWFNYEIGTPILLEKKGDRLFFAAKDKNETFSSENGFYRFSVNKQTSIKGNIMALLDRSVHQNYVPAFAFKSLFSQCHNLISAPQLPAIKIEEEAYASMFVNCSSLKTAPFLPATALSRNCYNSMFLGCSALTSPPQLESNEITEGCYESMFALCSALTTIPNLPATILKKNCYRKMFMGCSSLTTIPKLIGEISASNCYQDMFKNCSTLTHISNLSLKTLSVECFAGMYENCVSLSEIPENLLPIESLSQKCYKRMFANCSSLLHPPLLPATHLANECYQSMFNGCKSLVEIPMLPADTMFPSCYDSMFYNCIFLQKVGFPFTSQHLAAKCYSHMFEGCSSLYKAPKLEAKQMLPSCYKNMFANCTNLTQTQPNDSLPSLQLSDSCYFGMYKNCTSLNTPPTLPATLLSQSCYEEMFSGCSNLKHSIELPATQLATSCYNKMFVACNNLDTVIVKFEDWYCRYTTEDFFSPIYTKNWVSDITNEAVFVAPCKLEPKYGNSYIPSTWMFDSELDTVYDTVSPTKKLGSLRGCIDKLQVNRTFVRNGNFNTICLPFDCTNSDLTKAQHPLFDAEIYELSDAIVTNDTLNLRLTPTNNIYAGFPYLIRWMNKNDSITNPIFRNIEIKTDRIEDGYTKHSQNGLITMFSTLAPCQFDDRQHIFVLDGQPDLYLSISSDITSIKGFRAYFIVNSTAFLPPIPIVFDTQPHDYSSVNNTNTNNSIVKKILCGDKLYFEVNRKKYDIFGNHIK